jgi:hypothetical protein
VCVFSFFADLLFSFSFSYLKWEKNNVRGYD